MANTKTNIHQSVEKAFALYQSTQGSNNRLSSNAFDPVLSTLQLDFANCKLTDEELAVSGVTVERIEVQAQINNKVYFTKRLIDGFSHTAEFPESLRDWTLPAGNDTLVFEAFFPALPLLTGKLREYVDGVSPSISETEDLYEAWKILVTEEKLDAIAKDKVRQLIDLRRVLVAMIAYKGLSVEKIMEQIA